MESNKQILDLGKIEQEDIDLHNLIFGYDEPEADTNPYAEPV